MQQTQKNYSLALLMLILALGYIDRMALGVVLQAIKVDLQLTDTQLGLLTGLAFALFFSLIGLPIARWADRGDRVVIIALSTGVWGIAIALCSIAGSFVQLLLIRMAVAIGDAGAGPPANSLIPEYFSRGDRPRAVARYMLGVPIGLMVGYLAGGWLSEMYGWRMTFVVIGVPGLVLALLAAFAMQEPRRRIGKRHADDADGTRKAPQQGFKEVITTLAANATFRHLLAYFSVWYFCGWAFQLWTPAFFVRSHDLDTGELGTWLAAIYGSAGLLGTWLGGEWSSRYAPQNERVQLLAVAVVIAFSQIVGMGALLAPSQYWAFGWLAVGALGAAAVNGPLFATVQTLVHPSMRATALTLISLLPGFIGMGLGPSAAGALSDVLQPWVGDNSLRYALLAFTPGYLWAAWHLYRASQSVTRDIANALENEIDHEIQEGALPLATETTNLKMMRDEDALSSRT